MICRKLFMWIMCGNLKFESSGREDSYLFIYSPDKLVGTFGTGCHSTVSKEDVKYLIFLVFF